MTDRESVVAGLEDSLANNCCGFMDGIGELFAVSGEDLRNAIDLLKAQLDKTELIHCGGNYSQSFRCETCGKYCFFPQRYVKKTEYKVVNEYKFCPYCGREVKWE